MNIQLFPAIDDVFAVFTEDYKAVFFPLLTIDLSSIGKGAGKVHFITVYGNGDPEIVYPDNAGYNFIRFKRIGDKYAFEGNLMNMPKADKAIDWYKDAERLYQEHKNSGVALAALKDVEGPVDFDFDDYQEGSIPAGFARAHYVKGVLNYWVTRDQFFETGKFIQGGAYTHKESNHEREIYNNIDNYDDEYRLEYLEELLAELRINFNDLQFVGSLTGYNYSGIGEDEISLFVNKDGNEVLQYFCWG